MSVRSSLNPDEFDKGVDRFKFIRRSCALKAPGLLLVEEAPTVRWGKTFWRVRQFFFCYENGHSSETKSRKIHLKMRNPPSRQGLQTSHWRNPGSNSKKQIFGQKSESFGPNKTFTSRSKPCSSHDQAKFCKEKVPFSQISISLLADLGCFLEKKKTELWAKIRFSASMKTAVSLYFRPRPWPLSMWVIFLVAQMVPTSFVDQGPKLRVLIIEKWDWPEMAKLRNETRKMTPIS